MWPARDGEPRTVVCIACGDDCARSEAREYDKYGERWDREAKSFEFLCKPCFRSLSKAPRDGQEALLLELGAGRLDRAEFLERYLAAVESEGAPEE